MFNRFSKAARTVVVSAVAEAGRRGDHRVGTEHLLLGLLHDPASPAARALGTDLHAARNALRAMDVEALDAVGIAATHLPDRAPLHGRTGHVPFTSAAKSALARTLREATRRKDRRLEPVHLLLALLTSEAPDPAAALLARLDIDAGRVRDRLADAA